MLISFLFLDRKSGAHSILTWAASFLDAKNIVNVSAKNGAISRNEIIYALYNHIGPHYIGMPMELRMFILQVRIHAEFYGFKMACL